MYGRFSTSSSNDDPLSALIVFCSFCCRRVCQRPARERQRLRPQPELPRPTSPLLAGRSALRRAGAQTSNGRTAGGTGRHAVGSWVALHGVRQPSRRRPRSELPVRCLPAEQPIRLTEPTGQRRVSDAGYIRAVQSVDPAASSKGWNCCC